MKPFGSILEFACERNHELMRAYRFQIAQVRTINMLEIAKRVVNMPTYRFWVSEERATVVIAALLSGKSLPPNTRQTKLEMFSEILARTKELMKSFPELPLSQIVAKVVHSPAPKFYMLPRSAIDIIYKMKNGHYERIYANNPLYHTRNS